MKTQITTQIGENSRSKILNTFHTLVTGYRVQTNLENLENLEKKAFLKKLRENIENSEEKTEKSGIQGKLRELFCTMVKTFQLPQQLSRGVLKKRCSVNMQRIYKGRLMPKCDFNKVALHFYWNHTFLRTPLDGCFCNWFLELSNWVEINCRILDSCYFCFSETILLILWFISICYTKLP